MPLDDDKMISGARARWKAPPRRVSWDSSETVTDGSSGTAGARSPSGRWRTPRRAHSGITGRRWTSPVGRRRRSACAVPRARFAAGAAPRQVPTWPPGTAARPPGHAGRRGAYGNKHISTVTATRSQLPRGDGRSRPVGFLPRDRQRFTEEQFLALPAFFGAR